MKLYYLAAPFGHREQAKDAREKINTLGWECTSQWIDNHFQTDAELTPDLARREANSDISDVLEAEAFVFLNTGYSEGKMFELGYAYAEDIPIYLIGERTHIFHHLKGVRRYPSVEEFVADMRGKE